MLLQPLAWLLTLLLCAGAAANGDGSKSTATVVRVLDNQTFSKTLFILWDVRAFVRPEFSELTRVTLRLDEDSGLLTGEFAAFHRAWRLRLRANRFLLPRQLPAALHSAKGDRLDWLAQTAWQPIRSGAYVGTADAGATEQGWAALLYTGDAVRAYIATNINDYILNAPIADQVALDGLATGQAGQAGSNLSAVGEASWARSRPADGSAADAQSVQNQHVPKAATDFIKLGPLPRPSSGYELYAEIDVLMDKTWLDAVTIGFGFDRDAALAYTAELLHYAQVWYLHPSLGYRIWLRIGRFVLFNESYPDFPTQNFERLCEWQSKLPLELTSDFVLFLTGKRSSCNGLGGIAYPNEACNFNHKSRQCACVYHQRLQTNTLIRTIAHEIGHLVGMPDDYTGRTSELCYSGLMRYGVYEDNGWSTCAVQNLERFLFIQGNTCLHKSETTFDDASSQPPEQLPRNVAWRSRAWQSSTQANDELSWGAWKATDGHIFGVPYENSHGATENLLGHLSSCSQTKVQSRPWLVVQLDRANASQELLVHVYGREECCEHGLDNLTIATGNRINPQSHKVCRVFNISSHSGKYKLLSVRCPSGANFLSVQANGARVSLSVCEIYVFQEQPGGGESFSHSGESCFDAVRYCDEWKLEGDCGTDNRRYCRRTCGLCGPANWRTLARPDYKPGTPSAHCKDSHRYCRFYAANGLCSEKWAHCPLSCNKCDSITVAKPTQLPLATTHTARADKATSPPDTPPQPATKTPSSCADKDSNCKFWVQAGYCSHEHIAYVYCRKSCGTC